MTQAFSSYGRSVAVIFACAFAVFFAQELQSIAFLGAGALISGIAAGALWLRLRGTRYRFLVGMVGVVAMTFVTFLINMAYPGSSLAYFAAFGLFASLAVFTFYAFLAVPCED